MKEAIQKAVGLLFDALPFSRVQESARERTLSAACEKFDGAVREGTKPAEAAGTLLLHADTMEDLCSYLSIDPPAEAGAILPAACFGKLQRKLTRNLYLLSFFLSSLVGSLVSFLGTFSWKGLVVAAIYWGILGGLSFLLVRRQQRILRDSRFFSSSFDESCRKTAEQKYDLYTKKVTNTLFAGYSLLFLLLFSVLLAVTSFRFTVTDVLNTVTFYLTLIQLFVYLLFKNAFCRKLYQTFFAKSRQESYCREVRRLGIASAIYYAVFLVVLLLFRNQTEHSFSFGIAAIVLYFVLVLFYNVTRRGILVRQNLVIRPRKILCWSLAILCFFGYNLMKLDVYLLQPYINTVAAVEHPESRIAYDEDTGIYTIVTDQDRYKILQLTDIHLGGSILSVSEDTKALKACYRLIQAAKPDFVVVTGDLVFPLGVMSFSLNNNAPIMQFANFMRNTGIPWAFTYGNHDTESLATLSRAEVDSLLKSVSYKSSRNLLYPYVQPDIYGRSNQMIMLRHTDGTLMQALFLIDSNDYVEAGGINEYDYIHDDQVEWYRRTVQGLSEREGTTIPSMIFTHVPLQEYRMANQLYESGSSDVTYHYGILGEKMIDKICCSKYPSTLFETAVELGSTKAIFCGHDHYNNQSLTYRGIRLTYGYSIDYLAMPGIENDTEQRGATLITIEKDGSFAVKPYRLMDLDE